MPTTPPTTPDGWLAEIAAAMATTDRSAAEQGVDAAGDETRWRQYIEEQAVLHALATRAAPRPRDLDRAMDEITDLTVDLRRAAPGDPDNHHVNEIQHFLLYYLSAHLHAGLIDGDDAAHAASACWNAEPPEREGRDGDTTDGEARGDAMGDDDEEESEEEEGGEEDDDEPWPITRQPPSSVDAWLGEILTAWKRWPSPPPFRTSDGEPLVASEGTLLESAAILALHQRGAQAPAEAIYGLIGVIEEMEADIAGLGPEVENMHRIPALAFAIYYVWAHILIGHASEQQAMDVVHACSSRLDQFPAVGGKAGRRR